MSTNRPVLTDAVLRQALVELAAGPDAGDVTASVTRSVAATAQRSGLAWPLIDLSRRTTLILVAGLLLAGLAATLAVYSSGLPRPVPLPVVPSTVVTQVSNGLRGDAYAEVHTAFPPGLVTGTELTSNLPPNAVGLRWSPDGSRLAYFTREAPDLDGLATYTGVFVANADGNDPTPLELAHDMSRYFSSGWWNGVSWAPSGELLAVSWGCDEPDCDASGVEIFDAAGSPIAAWETSPTLLGWPIWSPDSAAMGWKDFQWETGGCENCFHWRTLTDDAVTSLSFPFSVNVTWSTDNRLQVVQYRSERGPAGNEGQITSIAERVYSMTPNGTDARDVAWSRSQVPVWSPDGRMLVAVDPVAGELVVLDLGSGDETIVPTPTGLYFAEWGPEGDRLMLAGNPAYPDAGRDIDGFVNGPYYVYLVNVDGSDALPLGRGDDFGWMPASVSEGEITD